MFLDGYTRGLDAATALELARTLSGIAWNMQGGLTVIASQYQASQEIFDTFDKVLVLQKEDDPDAPTQMVYVGPSLLCLASLFSLASLSSFRWANTDCARGPFSFPCLHHSLHLHHSRRSLFSPARQHSECARDAL